ncbi:hypothetical protein [Paraburkholderia silvatlantica]|uniref:hypothetical protein n=1 Tax=Paraburkholderia silvatlantica TaxID=321895 RepID=UPI00105E0BBE|nr:hypothetical protein [Paraburkholderia silvatlantica]TDQ97494.1 hypothetical protein C7412_108130 [Paraburkholderia silvatlantica]
MKRIIFLALSVLSLVTWVGSACGKEAGRVSRDDCHLSFLTPKGVEYVEVDGVINTGKVECYIAFKYTGALRAKPSGRMPAVPEDWRAMTDFALTVKQTPVADSLAQIESTDGASQHGLFKMVSKEHISLPDGDLYIMSYAATKPTVNMANLNETKEMVFVAGNNARSIVFPLYSGNRLSNIEKKKESMFKSLFSSLHFFY